MLVVGLSGGIATGKSTVSRLLARDGFTIVDCDLLARETTQKGSWGWRRVRKAFGDGVLGPDGELDRERLGALVFSDAAARRRLNAATHLPVALALLRRIAWHWLTCKTVVVVDAPLLFETGMYKLMSPNILVTCSDEQQLARLVGRDGGSEDRARARISAQMPLEAKRRLADQELVNEGSLEELEDKVTALGARLRRKARFWGLLTSPLALLAAAGAAVLLLR